jgi:putative oxidoreductase
MDYLFLLGRLFYGGFFVLAGINHFTHLSMMAGYAGANGVPAPKLAVIGSGIIVAIGGLSVLLGCAPTVGVFCIVLFLVPVTLMMHRFWADKDPQSKMMNQVNFQKNVALLGAALLLLFIPQPWPLSLAF